MRAATAALLAVACSSYVVEARRVTSAVAVDALNATVLASWDADAGRRVGAAVVLLPSTSAITARDAWSDAGAAVQYPTHLLVALPATRPARPPARTEVGIAVVFVPSAAAGAQPAPPRPAPAASASSFAPLPVDFGPPPTGLAGGVVNDVHLFARPLPHPRMLALGVAVAARRPVGPDPNVEYEVLLFNASHSMALTPLGGFPFHPQISCVDETASAMYAVFYDGKYPCFTRVNLLDGTSTYPQPPSTDPDGALWCLPDGELVSLQSRPLGPGYAPRAFDLLQVDTDTGVATKPLMSDLSRNITSALAPAVIDGDNRTATVAFFVTDNFSPPRLHAAEVSNLLTASPSFTMGAPLDTDGLRVLFPVR